MNTWIWRLVAHDDKLTFAHGTKRVSFPKRMFIAVPAFITDADVADLTAAYKRDRAKLEATP